MSFIATAIIGGSILGVGGALGAGYMQSQASERAGQRQEAMYERGLQQQLAQQAATEARMVPYQQAGEEALKQQRILMGLEGPEAQQAAISEIEQSPEFQEAVKQGEAGMLANASATGGLRGGNVQSALAQFRPQMLSALIQQRMAQLGGLTGMGQQSALGVAGMGQQSAANIANLYGQMGAAQAGAIMGQAGAWGGALQGIGGLGGTLMGAGLGGAFGGGRGGALGGQDRAMYNTMTEAQRRAAFG